MGLIGVGAGIGGITALIHGSLEAIDVNAKLSDRLGITTEKLVGLQHASSLAGVSSEDLTVGLEKMLRSISEAAGRGGTITLGKVKLDATELANGTTDAAIAKIADGLKGITNPAERAQAAVNLFGKAGQGLLPLMLAGSEGIKQAEEEAKKLGISFSRVDAAKVEAANDAFTRLQAVVTGVSQTLAIQLAPFIEALSVKLTTLATEGGGIGATVSAGFQKVLLTVAYASDGLNLLAAGWQVMRGAASYAIGGVLDGVGYLIDGLNKLLEKLHLTTIGGAGELHNLGKAFKATGDEAFTAAKQDYNDAADGKNYKAAKAGIAEIQTNANTNAQAAAASAGQLNGGKFAIPDDPGDKAAKSLEELQAQLKSVHDLSAQGIDPKYAEEINRLGLKGDQIKQWLDLKQQVDATTKAFTDAAEAKKKVDELRGELAALKAGGDGSAGKLEASNPEAASLQKQIDLMKERNEMLKEASTPMEKFQKQLDDINQMYKSGLIDQTQYDKLTDKANKDFDKNEEKEGPKQIDVKAEARRFALVVPQSAQVNTDAQKLALQQKSVDSTTSIDNNLQQLVQKFTGLNTGSDSSGLSIDDLA